MNSQLALWRLTVDGYFTRLGVSTCPWNTLVAPTPRNESVGGCNFLVHCGELLAASIYQ